MLRKRYLVGLACALMLAGALWYSQQSDATKTPPVASKTPTVDKFHPAEIARFLDPIL